MEIVNDYKDDPKAIELKSNDFTDIKKFRTKAVRKALDENTEERKTNKKMISYIFILKLIVMVASPALVSIAIIVPEDPFSIIKALACFTGAITISLEAGHVSLKSESSKLKNKHDKLNLKTSKGLDDGSLDHSDFESILDINDG